MPENMENVIFMENSNPMETPLMMEVLTVKDQAPLLPQNPKTVPSAQENPSSGIMEPQTTYSVDNGLSNEALDFTPIEDFHPGSQGSSRRRLVQMLRQSHNGVFDVPSSSQSHVLSLLGRPPGLTLISPMMFLNDSKPDMEYQSVIIMLGIAMFSLHLSMQNALEVRVLSFGMI
ncbi:hypothetical protein ACH5RR_037241 [Cinchona calisaya]|uniref:Uncharacterized protein n=1 Tax=Cinchona calisaya TaxID=153742 RepID=A0ABD2Y8P6_9GENT